MKRFLREFYSTAPERKSLYGFLLLCNLFVLSLVYLKLSVEVKCVESVVSTQKVEYIVVDEGNATVVASSGKKFNNNSTDSAINRKNVSKDVGEQQKEEVPSAREIVHFSFDPNSISYDSLVLSGFSGRTARSIINYRNAGATYRSLEDLKKVYVISDEEVAIAESYAVFASSPTNVSPQVQKELRDSSFRKKKSRVPYWERDEYKNYKIDINLATAEDFKKLRGIGKVYSERIVKYRDILGGFVNVHHLSTTWGIPDSTFQSIKPHLYFETAPKKSIRINTADVDELARHPLLYYREARALVNYRSNHGYFNDSLKFSKVLSVKEAKKDSLYIYIDWTVGEETER